MNISRDEVAGANFRTDKASDELNTKFTEYLGMKNRYQPARLAIARSLANTAAVPMVLGENTDLNGRIIKGDTLFGTGTSLAIWIALIVEHSGDTEIDKARLIELVAMHWRRGIKQLNIEWQKSEQDVTQFIKRLVGVAGIPLGSSSIGIQSADTQPDTGGFSSGEITVPIGEISEDIATSKQITWSVNGSGGSPHSAIMGGVGSGKTRTAVAMLQSIHEQAPDVPLIAFDFKGDLGGGDKTYKIDELFSAHIIAPLDEPIPLDALFLPSTEERDVSIAARHFREAFNNLKATKLGEVQRNSISEAAKTALRAQSPCELRHVLDALSAFYEENDKREDSAISVMRDLCEFTLFQPKFNPASFFQKSWLIKLPQDVPEDVRKIVVNLVLNALSQHLNSLVDSSVSADGSRSLRVVCMVDEAHQILGRKFPALSNLMRMSRSKGGAIMLISQSPDDFSGADTDFLNEMGLVAAFSTNASARNTANILGKGAKLSALQLGQCLVKRRGDSASKKIQSWQAN